MKPTTLLALAITLAACGGDAEEAITPPRADSDWSPFAYGEHSVGELGVARFQVAPCAYSEMVGQLPSCALDLPMLLGHQTAVLVELDGEDTNGLTLRSTEPAIVVNGVEHDGGYLRATLTAASPGDSSLVVERGDGVQIDRVIARVREASSITVTIDDVTDPPLAVGEQVSLRATPRSEEGEVLNAYAELSWALLDGTGALRLHGTRGWRVQAEAQATGDERLQSRLGILTADLEVTVE
jgi:hypothetical protein